MKQRNKYVLKKYINKDALREGLQVGSIFGKKKICAKDGENLVIFSDTKYEEYVSSANKVKQLGQFRKMPKIYVQSQR